MAKLVIKTFDGHDINDGTNYEATFAPANPWGHPRLEARMSRREGAWPVVTNVDRRKYNLDVMIAIKAADIDGARDNLLEWLFPKDGKPRLLVITDDGGGNERYVEALCVDLKPETQRPFTFDNLFSATFVVSGDVKWRATSVTTDTWNITGSPETHTISNGGKAETYPIYRITPTSSKSSSAGPYKRYISIVWRSPESAWKYPVRLGPFDTQTGSTNFSQADGSDIRVFSGGSEVERYIVDPDTASTYVWVILNFDAQTAGTLNVSLPSTGEIAYIETQDPIDDWPSSGILRIGSEEFRYGGKDTYLQRFTEISRSVRNTSAAAHSIGDTIDLIPHDLIMTYGSASPETPLSPDDYEPMFDIASSTNTLWKYSNFGELGSLQRRVYRPASWHGSAYIDNNDNAGGYNDAQRTFKFSGEFSYIGIYIDNAVSYYWWSIVCPGGIVNAEWNTEGIDGSFRRGGEDFLAFLFRYTLGDSKRSTIRKFTADDILAVDSWGTWNQGKDDTDWDPPARSVSMSLYWYDSEIDSADVNLYLSSTYTPTVTVNSGSGSEEVGNYQLNMTLKNFDLGDAYAVVAVDTGNETFTVDGKHLKDFSSGSVFEVEGSTGNDGIYTVSAVSYDEPNDQTTVTVTGDLTDSTADGTLKPGQSIKINMEVDLNGVVEIDTEHKTVTYLEDGSSQFGALAYPEGVREDWLPLVSGDNRLRFEDSGTAGLTIETRYRERWY